MSIARATAEAIVNKLVRDMVDGGDEKLSTFLREQPTLVREDMLGVMYASVEESITQLPVTHGATR